MTRFRNQYQAKANKKIADLLYYDSNISYKNSLI